MLMTPMARNFLDVTVPITPSTIVFPGDPTFRADSIMSIRDGQQYDLRQMQLSNHTGTHIDFPAHVIAGGKTSSDYPIDHFIGEGLVIEVPQGITAIDREILMPEQSRIKRGDKVLLKTSNSILWATNTFKQDFVYLTPSGARFLLDCGVSMVGIDYLSVDGLQAEDLPVHHLLLSSGVLIIEGLNLSLATPGRYIVYCLPLNASSMDGLPARVVLEKIA